MIFHILFTALGFLFLCQGFSAIQEGSSWIGYTLWLCGGIEIGLNLILPLFHSTLF